MVPDEMVPDEIVSGDFEPEANEDSILIQEEAAKPEGAEEGTEGGAGTSEAGTSEAGTSEAGTSGSKKTIRFNV
jgi:hypothetical protein